MSLEQAGEEVKAQKKRWGKRRSNGALKKTESSKDAGKAGDGAGGEGEGRSEEEPAAKKMKFSGGGGLSGKGKVMGKKRSS